MSLTHGGDWAGFEAEYRCPALDFSANVSPLGVPEGVRAAIEKALPTADRYPDPLCRALCEKLAVFHKVPASYVLCGNGAADLIFRLVLAKRPKAAMVTAPSFAEYEQALTACGCTVRTFLLRKQNDFAITEAILEYITPQLDLLFLCEPNNPTGRTTEPALLHRILQKCKACGTLLVVDECFNEFLDAPQAHTLLPMLCDFSNLLVLKAFTKCYAMAGVRLGYALCSDAALLGQMRRSGQPWAVSGLAQAAGVAALNETAYVARLRSLIATERPRLQKELEALGCAVYPGEANYLLFFCKDALLAQKLRVKKVLVRDCSNYAGLGVGWYRAAVRTAAENTAFLKAMKEVL